MQSVLIPLLVFLIATLISSVFIRLAIPQLVTHQIIALLVLCFVCLSLVSQVRLFRDFFITKGKWLVLLLLTVIVQLLLISTGGLLSTFFILFNLFILGISFFFSFSVAVLFVLFSLPLFGLAMISNPVLLQAVLDDPATPILYLLSCLSILPVSYILASRYHFKSKITNILQKQLELEDTILDNLHELVIVTDSSLNIVSVNDVVERVLHRSRAELIQIPLFNVLYIKDSNGVLLTPEKLSLPMLLEQKNNKEMQDLTMVTTTVSPKKVSMRITPINDVDGKNHQLSIIITEKSGYSNNLSLRKEVQLALTKHQAAISSFKKILGENRDIGMKTKLILLENSEQDIITILRLDELLSEARRVRFDIAHMGKKTLAIEQEFADTFHVPLDFAFENFGKNDIEPIIAGQQAISYDQLTGPFFTISYDIRLVSLALQKLVRLGILFASSQKNPLVQVRLTRSSEQKIQLAVSASCSPKVAEHKHALFSMYYGVIAGESNLALGSGLEGVILKTVTDRLEIPLTIEYQEEIGRINFRFTFSRHHLPLT